MFDNLRESASSSSFYEDEINSTQDEIASKTSAAPVGRSNSRFLGMNATQRFIISLMIFFTVCVIGTLAMFILGKMSLF